MNFTLLKRYFRSLFDLKSSQEDENQTYKEILEGAEFRGKNLWLLAFAIFIACIGLNINSKSAVIGAMILSPVMGPVFGIGFAIGVSNTALFKTSLKNAFQIILVSIFFSTLYYLINPYHIITDELISFSQPTFFDVALAFLGGMAAMLAISRESGTQVIIAVAVATSCIPPLCTAGFGLATLNWEYFIGGLYTYCINSIFIGFGTLLMTKYLKFKPHSENQFKKESYIFIFISLITMAPALYFAFQLAKENIFQYESEQLIKNEIENKYHVVNYSIDSKAREIILDVSCTKFNSNINNELKDLFQKSNINLNKLEINQDIEDNIDLTKEILKLKLEISKIKKN